MREVADAEGDGVEVDCVGGDGGEVFGVGFEEGGAVGVGGVFWALEALAAFGQHFGVDVGDDDAG